MKTWVWWAWLLVVVAVILVLDAVLQLTVSYAARAFTDITVGIVAMVFLTAADRLAKARLREDDER